MAAEIGPALGLNVDSNGVLSAIDDLNKITKAAGGAEKAADGFSGSGRRMSSAMSQAIAVLRGMDGSLARLTQAHRQNNNGQDEAARKAAALSAQYAQLRGALDPLYANSKRYEASLETLNAAQAAGMISTQEYQRSLAMLDAQFSALNSTQASVGQNTAVVGNVFAQFNDIGMMAFAGQSPLMLAIQQGTQLNQVWGTLGGSTKAIGGVMKQAFMQLLNPLNLVTLGVIAGGAALLQWAMNADWGTKKAKNLEDSMDGLRDSLSKIADAQEILKRSNADLFAEFGLQASAVRRAAQDLVDAQRIMAEIELKNALKAARSELNLLGRDLDSLKVKHDAAKAAIDGMNASQLRGAIEMASALQNYRDAVAAAGELASKLKISQSEAEALTQQFYNLKNANDLAGRISALNSINEILKAAGVNAADLPEELAKALASASAVNFELAKSDAEIKNATGATGAWSSAMSGVLGFVRGIASGLSAISGKGIEIASAQAEIDAIKAGRTLQQAAHVGRLKQIELEGKARIGELTREKGLVGAIQGLSEIGAARRLQEKQHELAVMQDQKRKSDSDEKKMASAGARELKAAQKGFQSLRELMEEESIFQFAEYEKRQTQLDTALQKRLLSEQAYRDMSAELRTLYFGSEWEQQLLRYEMDQEALQIALDQKLITEEEYYRKRKELQWANLLSEDNRSDMAQDLSNTSQYFSQLYSMTGSSLDGLLKLQKSFSAASALISAWEGYAKALADGGMTPWMRLAWAGKILAAGMGAVSAIKGASKGGAGGGSASAGGVSQSQQAPETPLRVSVDAFDTNQLYTGSAVINLFNMIQKEAGNRGIQWVATN